MFYRLGSGPWALLLALAVTLAACALPLDHRQHPDCHRAAYVLDDVGVCVLGQTTLTPELVDAAYVAALQAYAHAFQVAPFDVSDWRRWNEQHSASVTFGDKLPAEANGMTVCDDPMWEDCDSMWSIVRTGGRTRYDQMGTLVHELFHVGHYRDTGDADPYHQDRRLWGVATQARLNIPDSLGLVLGQD